MDDQDWTRSGITVEELFKSKSNSENQEREDIDELNDETFGDGAVEDDWEAFHFASVNQSVPVKTQSDSAQHQDGRQNNNFSDAIEQTTAKVQDCTLNSLKELWGSSPKQSSPLDTIWSSPEIPHLSRGTVNNKVSSSPKHPLSNKMITVEDLERGLLQNSPSPPPLSSASSSSSSHPHTLPPHILHNLSPSPTPSPSPPMPVPRGVYVRPPLIHYPMPSAGYPMTHPSRRPLLRQPIPHPYMIHPRGPPPNLPPNIPVMGPPRVITGFLPHPALIRPMPFHPIHPHHAHPMHHHHPPTHHATPLSSKCSEMLCDLKPDGSGFMNRKEKEWVIKVQLMQLHTTTPETDDYYYQRYSQKKLTQDHEKEGIIAVKDQVNSLTLPPPVNQEDKKKKDKEYSSVEFQKSLGKVSVGSISAPRKTIEVAPPVLNDGQRESGNKRRRVLLTIEEMYNILLELDDLEQQSTSNETYSKQREKLCEKLFGLTRLKAMQEGSPTSKKEGEVFFQQLLQFKKGKVALERYLPYLSEVQAKLILLCISKNIAAIIKKDSVDKMLPQLLPVVNGVILTLHLREVIQHLSLISPCLTTKLYDNQFFMEFLTALVKRGIQLVSSWQSTNIVNQDEISEWHSVNDQLQKSLHSLETKSVSVIELVHLLTTPP